MQILNDVTLFCYGNSQHFMAFAPFVQGLRCQPSAHHHWRVTSPCREPRSQPNCWVQRQSCGRSLEHEQSISRCPPAVKLCRCVKDVWGRLSVLYIYIYICKYTGYMGLHIRVAWILMPSYIVEMGRSDICEDH